MARITEFSDGFASGVIGPQWTQVGGTDTKTLTDATLTMGDCDGPLVIASQPGEGLVNQPPFSPNGIQTTDPYTFGFGDYIAIRMALDPPGGMFKLQLWNRWFGGYAHTYWDGTEMHVTMGEMSVDPQTGTEGEWYSGQSSNSGVELSGLASPKWFGFKLGLNATYGFPELMISHAYYLPGEAPWSPAIEMFAIPTYGYNTMSDQPNLAPAFSTSVIPTDWYTEPFYLSIEHGSPISRHLPPSETHPDGIWPIVAPSDTVMDNTVTVLDMVVGTTLTPGRFNLRLADGWHDIEAEFSTGVGVLHLRTPWNTWLVHSPYGPYLTTRFGDLGWIKTIRMGFDGSPWGFSPDSLAPGLGWNTLLGWKGDFGDGYDVSVDSGPSAALRTETWATGTAEGNNYRGWGHQVVDLALLRSQLTPAPWKGLTVEFRVEQVEVSGTDAVSTGPEKFYVCRTGEATTPVELSSPWAGATAQAIRDAGVPECVELVKEWNYDYIESGPEFWGGGFTFPWRYHDAVAGDYEPAHYLIGPDVNDLTVLTFAVLTDPAPVPATDMALTARIWLEMLVIVYV